MTLGDLHRVTGRELRRARLEAGLTLEDVRALSGESFKPSSVGAYERAQRVISLSRFVALAAIYGVPADRLLARVIESFEKDGAQVVVLDGPPPEGASVPPSRRASADGDVRALVGSD